MDNLALRYRPRRFDDLVGQHAAQVFLRQMIAKDRIPRALMFDGSRGTGKTTTARIFAAALNCASDDKPCGACPSCEAVFNGSSLDVLEIDAASNGLVDDVRNLRQQIQYRTTGAYRVVIFDEAQSASHAAFNAMLKTIEEPPAHTVFIFCTTEPHKIPDTVASRCIPFTFRRHSAADIASRLTAVATAEGFAVDAALIAQLAERADGAMRNGLMLLDQVTSVGLTTAEQYQRLIGRIDHAPAIITALISGNLATAFSAIDEALHRVADPRTVVTDLITLLRDVLVLRTGGDIAKTGKALADRQNIALILDTPIAVAAMKVFWELETKVRATEPRAALELAVVMLADIFKTVTPVAPPARLSLADMTRP